MSSTTIILPTVPTIGVNTIVTQSLAILPPYNYWVNVNLSLNKLFGGNFNFTNPATVNSSSLSANYIQSSTNPDQYNINLVIDKTYLNYVLFTPRSGDIFNYYSDGLAYGARQGTPGDVTNASFNTKYVATTGITQLSVLGGYGDSTSGVQSRTTDTLGLRLSEIAALKIFTNANARAAIINDGAVANGTQMINNATDSSGVALGAMNLSNAVTTLFQEGLNKDKNVIFNQYVASNPLIRANDVTGPASFNFNNFILNFVIRFNSNVLQANGQVPYVFGGVNSFSQNLLISFVDIGDVVPT